MTQDLKSDGDDMTVINISQAASPPQLPHPIAAWLDRIDAPHALVRYVAISNAIILLCLLWMLLVPESSIGILRLPAEDMGLRRSFVVTLFAAVFFMDVAQALRGVRASWTYLTSLSGQAILALIALVYTTQGKIGLVGFYTHAGPFILSFIGVLVAIQRAKLRPPWFVPPWMRQNTRQVMLTSVSIFLLTLAWGLLTRPDTNIALFIQNRYGLGFFIVMIGLLLWGAGQLRHNHMKPWQALRRMFGLWLYAFMTAYLLLTDNNEIAPLTVFLSLNVPILATLFAVIQAQDTQVA